MALSFITLHGPWTADGETFAGEVTVEKPSAELVKLAGSAHAAGAIDVTEGLDVSHVEDDEISQAKLAAAMGEWVEAVRDPETGVVVEPGYWTGPWHDGNLAAHEATLIGSGASEVAVDAEASE